MSTPGPANAPGPGLSRRRVLGAIAAGGAVLVTGALGYLAVGPDAGEDDGGAGADDPTSPVPIDQALLAVGQRYLDAYPDEADTQVLLAGLAPLGGSVPAEPATQLGVLAQQVADDYASGDVVELDGWLLSRTEGRAAALYALGH